MFEKVNHETSSTDRPLKKKKTYRVLLDNNLNTIKQKNKKHIYIYKDHQNTKFSKHKSSGLKVNFKNTTIFRGC